MRSSLPPKDPPKNRKLAIADTRSLASVSEWGEDANYLSAENRA